jgi:glutamate-1-semialdehyde aminotransferase
MKRHTSIFFESLCGDVVNNTSGTECLVSAMRLAKPVTHLRPYNVRFLNCATVDVESKK